MRKTIKELENQISQLEQAFDDYKENIVNERKNTIDHKIRQMVKDELENSDYVTEHEVNDMINDQVNDRMEDEIDSVIDNLTVTISR